MSPSKFESQATNSPTKISVPNRKQRNQPTSRVHDIEFATEISTSLLTQVRHLQALLAEKEEALRTVTLEKSRLEADAEGFEQRLRSLNESEHRYKDENWTLETQIHEHIASAKEAADREKKLTQALHALQAEKAAAQKELDETKLVHAGLVETHAAAVKHYDVELGSVKRSMAMFESDRSTLQRRIDDLTSQNQELAMAVAQQRGRLDERDQVRGISDDDLDADGDQITLEQSPPPSPIKGTPRHGMLESETLKSSLHHAHRMIQNLKGNIHREKTEKLELKRMLQEARDELEARRGDVLGGPGNGKRSKKTDSKEFKKPLKPGQLGGVRTSRSEIDLEDPLWEDHDGLVAGSQPAGRGPAGTSVATSRAAPVDEYTDHFENANEASDAFETANERGTETEDFHTGVEDLSGSDDLTETEAGPVQTGKPKVTRPSMILSTRAGNRQSFQSTASLSGDEYSYEDMRTPVQTQPQRLRLRMNKGSARRTRLDSEEPNFNSSPASFATSTNSTPQVAGQTLFAELEDLGGDSEDDSVDATPSKRSVLSANNTPASRPGTAQRTLTPRQRSPLPTIAKPTMVDSAMMTDEWVPASLAQPVLEPAIGTGHAASLPEVAVVPIADAANNRPDGLLAVHEHTSADAGTQWHDQQQKHLLEPTTVGDGRPISIASDVTTPGDSDIEKNLARFPVPPRSTDHIVERQPVPLSLSSIQYEHVEPETDRESGIFGEHGEEPEIMSGQEKHIPAALALSMIHAVATEPVSPARAIEPVDTTPVATRVASEAPQTPKNTNFGSLFGWHKGKQITAPFIAEDETRQSPSDSPQTETPESQRPFKEISANAMGAKKHTVVMADESSQTALTAQQIESMLREKTKRKDTTLIEDLKAPAPTSPPRVPLPMIKNSRSQESIGSVGRARAKMAEPDFTHDSVQLKRPSSAGSNRGSISASHPPLPTDHKQVIAAAAQRVGSAGSVQGTTAPAPGTMGPPLVPASAYKSNPAFRPRTPSINAPNPLAATTVRAGAGSRAGRASESADIQAPSIANRSRRSSFSSFVSEVDNRFNLRQNMPHGMDPGADPRMIQAITQTMIGEYLWKYTRKTGRGEMSENRHRRYFWVHPYTRTLYWSDRDPQQAGRAELKAKSVAIEAVRVVTDDNPMPPGLHRKSLVILTPGRAVKFTAATGQRHETWFNALSYLLLRTNDAVGDSEDVASGALTREDVDEFNPGYGNRSMRHGPPSLSSYNSRPTTRNESPAPYSIRASTYRNSGAQETKSSRVSTGTFSRLSNYWRPGKESAPTGAGTGRGRQSMGGRSSIYEASEVHDSAEDLREMIERQDRESDRLENVRACCDGETLCAVSESYC